MNNFYLEPLGIARTPVLASTFRSITTYNMISNWDVEFIYHSIIRENAKHFWFYTHNGLRIKALLSALNIILSNGPEKKHSITSAAHRIFFQTQQMKFTLLWRSYTHRDTHTSYNTWIQKGQRPFFICHVQAKGKMKGHKSTFKVNIPACFGSLTNHLFIDLGP